MIKVLVVDDSALVRKLFGRVLSSEAEFEVAFARDGLEALAQLEEFKPDVITLDVQMPQMNGLECLDRIMLQRPSPVVMVSTVTAEGADATLDALRLGAVDFIAKPTGAVSLRIDEFAPVFTAKIRMAATAKLPASRRLRERVQFKTGAAAPRPQATRPEITEALPDAPQGDGIVLVGTSTGGPPALEALLVPLPASFPWPILVAQHMPAGFTGPLARRLDGICSLKVVEASSPMPLQAGCVYIGRGDADIIVSKRARGLVVMPAPAKANYPWHPSTDRLVRSAMEHMPQPAHRHPDDRHGRRWSGSHGRTSHEAVATRLRKPKRRRSSGECPANWCGRTAPRGLFRCRRLHHACEPWCRHMPLVRKPTGQPPQPAPDASSVLGNLVSDRTDERWAAARAAADVPDATLALAAALRNENDARVREAMFTSLARIGTRESADILIAFLRSDNANLRAGALDALRIMIGEMRDLLPRLLGDRDVDIRILSCELARALPGPEATTLLCTLLAAEQEAMSARPRSTFSRRWAAPPRFRCLAECAQRFRDNPFLGFAIKTATDRINSQFPASRA